MITFSQTGDFKKTHSKFQHLLEIANLSVFDRYGEMGVEALQSATPKRTGKTADSWTYEIHHKKGEVSIVWKNTNTVRGENIALLLQYGHGTGRGGYVQGRDYINPAMKPVFDRIIADLKKEVRNIE